MWLPRVALFTLFFSALFVLIPPANAMTVTPTEIEMKSTGRTSRSAITVVNNGEGELAVELVAKKAILNEDGVHKTSPAGDVFLIMPPQALIPPGATQNFRIQWLGEPLLNKSETYFIYVNQIPVKLPKRVRGVQLVFGMGVMINVAPPRGEPELQVVNNGVVTDRHGARHPTITVLNPTNVHALFPQATVRLSSGGWSETLSSGKLAQTIGIGLVQPGHRRRFVLPVTLPSGVTSTQSSIEFRPKP
jgi:P pilus assembly chaperone PapD